MKIEPKIYKHSKIPLVISYLSPMNWINMIQGKSFVSIWGFTFLWFIFIEGEGNEELIAHETIHVLQGLETFFVGFYLLYLWDWIVGFIKYRDAVIAYERIRAEQEAHHLQHNPAFLLTRKKRAWISNFKV